MRAQSPSTWLNDEHLEGTTEISHILPGILTSHRGVKILPARPELGKISIYVSDSISSIPDVVIQKKRKKFCFPMDVRYAYSNRPQTAFYILFLPFPIFYKPIGQCDCKSWDVFVVFSSDISLLERNCFSCLYPAFLLLCSVGWQTSIDHQSRDEYWFLVLWQKWTSGNSRIPPSICPPLPRKATSNSSNNSNRITHLASSLNMNQRGLVWG